MAIDAFLNFLPEESSGHGGENNLFLKLDSSSAFLKIGHDIYKLATARADSFLKIEHNRHIQHDVSKVSDFFLKQGEGLTGVANFALKIDDFVIKLLGGDSTSIGSATGGAGAGKATAGPQADFLKLDQGLAATGGDLKIFAADFLKLDHSSSLQDYKVNLGAVADDFIKLQIILTGDRDTFQKLSSDLLKIGDVANPSPLDHAYKELGGDLHKVSTEFGALANDFLKLNQAFGDGSVLGGLKNSPGSASTGQDFLKIEQGFLKLDFGLAHLGGATGQLIGLLMPNPTGGAT